jgi:homogentisate 1,2-dioxygenase
VEKALGQRRTEELAVMWDTFRPLRLAEDARELDDPEYAYSWREGAPSPVAQSTTG